MIRLYIFGKIRDQPRVPEFRIVNILKLDDIDSAPAIDDPTDQQVYVVVYLQ